MKSKLRAKFILLVHTLDQWFLTGAAWGLRAVWCTGLLKVLHETNLLDITFESKAGLTFTRVVSLYILIQATSFFQNCVINGLEHQERSNKRTIRRKNYVITY